MLKSGKLWLEVRDYMLFLSARALTLGARPQSGLPLRKPLQGQ